MTKQEAMQQAIEKAKGRPMFAGDVVAHESDPIAYGLDGYEGKDALCSLPDGTKKRFPRDEIFSPKLVVNIANHLINLGFWKEGMESMIVTIGH